MVVAAAARAVLVSTMSVGASKVLLGTVATVATTRSVTVRVLNSVGPSHVAGVPPVGTVASNSDHVEDVDWHTELAGDMPPALAPPAGTGS